ncbi:helix-turn-helix domain-containing protein [Halogeometricum limi]|uniref:GAF and HTH_10 associated domain-containing protein n=1 Tax=Halogeometricum limi TaxID=555875 RepID=A0A1I6HDY1_9EURY|nr:helix-turn-helix domain-containing protein [Halogeometricum limi]SFR52568.1 GAF and HTH_10 associated domain-containing protein [Halogeometricum limi]
MAVVAHFLIDAESFDLGRVTQVASGVHIELERVVPTTGSVMPFFWASGTDFETFERSVREDKLVEELNALTRIGDKVLYHVIWGETASSLTEIIAASDATILEASGNHQWSFRIRFQDHRGLRDFHNSCREYGIDFHVERIYTLEEEYDSKYNFDVTPEQLEALVSAVEGGYFEVPRGVTLTEVAEDLGISQQAASERVRRAADTVLRRVLLSRSADDF